jgi:hypothetical protein
VLVVYSAIEREITEAKERVAELARASGRRSHRPSEIPFSGQHEP